MLTIEPLWVSAIQAAEGCRLVAYRDSKGLWTIGWGHKLDQSIDWTGHTITQATADALLVQDLTEHVNQAIALPEGGSDLSGWYLWGLAECVYNLGVDTWEKDFPHARGAIQGRKWIAASQAILQSPEWIKDVGFKRVERIAGYFASGSCSLRPGWSLQQ